MNWPRQVVRALRLRCPVCGVGSVFCGWFRMHSVCPSCGVSFEREPGFYLGSIYFNYGITAIVSTIGYVVLSFGGFVSDGLAKILVLIYAMTFPVFFFPYSRCLWLGLDQLWDPRTPNRDSDKR